MKMKLLIVWSHLLPQIYLSRNRFEIWLQSLKKSENMPKQFRIVLHYVLQT